MDGDSVQPLDDAQRKRVERHRDRIPATARAVARLLPHMDVEELEGLGVEGLVEAARRYDPETGVPFGAFAHYRIRGSMIDGARKLQRAGRQHARAIKMLESSQALLESACEDAKPTTSPTASSTRVEDLRARVAKARAIVERTAAAAQMSQAMPAEPDTVAGSGDDVEQRMISAELRARLRDCVATLAPDDRKLVEALYEREVSMNAVAAEFGVNKSTISRRHNRILGQLAQQLRAREGPDS